MIIDQIVSLRVMLDEMEQDIGLDKLSPPEKRYTLLLKLQNPKTALFKREIF